jgi:hypothetical protein
MEPPGADDHGAGFIWQAAAIAGKDRVLDALRDEMLGWLAEPAER